MCSCSLRLPMISAIKDLVAASPVPVVFDHFGGAQAELGVGQPGFSDLLELVKSGKAYVKISGAYRASKLAPDYPDAAPLAQALIAANPDRIVWGTDWPHPDSVTPPGKKATDVTPLFQIDDGRLLNQLPVWAPDAAITKEDPGRQSRAALRVLAPAVTALGARNRRSAPAASRGSPAAPASCRSQPRPPAAFAPASRCPRDSAAGNSPTPATTQVINTGRSCNSPVRITARTRS